MANVPYHDEDEDKAMDKKRSVKEWDCPDCNANNPAGEPIFEGDEIRCNYCGEEYKVLFTEGGKLKLKGL